LQKPVNAVALFRLASLLAGACFKVQGSNLVEPIGEPLRQFFFKSRREASK
jgi:hypothetical protein